MPIPTANGSLFLFPGLGRASSPSTRYLDMTRRATAFAANENPEIVPFVIVTAASAAGAPPPVIRSLASRSCSEMSSVDVVGPEMPRSRQRLAAVHCALRREIRDLIRPGPTSSSNIDSAV